MRVLHVVKTSDGALWAANQAEMLVRSGVEVHAALPSEQGRTMEAWRDSGAHLHIADLSLPLREPQRLVDTVRRIRRLVDEVQPDLIHSHFVTTTLALRLALGKQHKVPRIFQVPGPLHLEHWHTRLADLLTAGTADYWIGSSKCIVEHYRAAQISADRLFLSYYGVHVTAQQCTGALKRRLSLPADAKLVGNINYIYPPKRFLGESAGLKGHEIVIDALAEVVEKRGDVYGVLIGATHPLYSKSKYEEKLRERAQIAGRGRILMPGYFGPSEVAQSWPEFDCAVHFPVSENCGGVVEPLAAGVPVIAADIGGLPEVVIDNLTGKIVSERTPRALAHGIIHVLSDLEQWRTKAWLGQRLVNHMFDVQRTASEVHAIYRAVLQGAPRPEPFDSQEFALSAVEMVAV